MCSEFLSAERSVRYAPRQCQSNPSAGVWLLTLGFPAGPDFSTKKNFLTLLQWSCIIIFFSELIQKKLSSSW